MVIFLHTAAHIALCVSAQSCMHIYVEVAVFCSIAAMYCTYDVHRSYGSNIQVMLVLLAPHLRQRMNWVQSSTLMIQVGMIDRRWNRSKVNLAQNSNFDKFRANSLLAIKIQHPGQLIF